MERKSSAAIPKKRFLIYALVGFIFGVIDWFYVNWFPNAIGNQFSPSIIMIPVIILLNYGIWLVPIIPIVIIESKKTDHVRYPIYAGILVWVCAIAGYYLYYTLLLSTGKLPNLEHLSLFVSKYESFWLDYWRMFRRIILLQGLEWLPVAIVGGAVMGALAYWIFSDNKNGNT